MKAKSSAAPAKNAARNQAASPQAQHLAKTHAAVKSTVESPGRPLDANTKDAMQSRFGYDFSSVRVHADDKASESARMLGAHAYTTGRHIAFGDGKYAPNANGGRDLIAHELTHVVQQAHGPVEGTPHGGLSISHPNDSHERAATGRASRRNGSQHLATPLSPLPANAFAPSHLPVQRKLDLSTVLGVAGSSTFAASAASLYSSVFGKHDSKGAGRITSASSLISKLAPTLTSALKRDSAGLGAGIKVNEGNKFPSSEPVNLTQDDYKKALVHEPKILELSTDDLGTNKASLHLNFMTCKNQIISASLELIGKKGYAGGQGSSAEVLINYRSLSGSSAPSTNVEKVDAVAIEIRGTNSFPNHPKQTFSGSIIAKGDGTVEQGIKASQNEYGDVDYGQYPNDYLYANRKMKGAWLREFLQPASGDSTKEDNKSDDKPDTPKSDEKAK